MLAEWRATVGDDDGAVTKCPAGDLRFFLIRQGETGEKGSNEGNVFHKSHHHPSPLFGLRCAPGIFCAPNKMGGKISSEKKGWKKDSETVTERELYIRWRREGTIFRNVVKKERKKREWTKNGKFRITVSVCWPQVRFSRFFSLTLSILSSHRPLCFGNTPVRRTGVIRNVLRRIVDFCRFISFEKWTKGMEKCFFLSKKKWLKLSGPQRLEFHREKGWIIVWSEPNFGNPLDFCRDHVYIIVSFTPRRPIFETTDLWF